MSQMKPFIEGTSQPLLLHITELRDATTGSDLLRTKKGDVAQVEFVEFRDDGMLLATPEGVPMIGGHLIMTFHTVNFPTELRFSATAKIVAIDAMPDRRHRLHLKLMQFDAEGWRSILNALLERQSAVTELFNTIKGG